MAPQVLAAVDSIAEQMQARDRAMVITLQQYSRRVHYQILTPVQVCLLRDVSGSTSRDAVTRTLQRCRT